MPYPAKLSRDAVLDAALALDDALARLRPAAAPDAVLLALADAYVRYARARPARYALLAGPGVPAAPGAERKALWNRLLAAVGAVTGDADDTPAAVAVWAFLHGFVALEQAGLFGASGPRGGLAAGAGALARGLRGPRGPDA